MYSAVLLAAIAAPLASAMSVQRRAAITDFKDGSPVAWDWPEGRGFASDTATKAPCGGFAASSTRTPYPLTGGQIALTQLTDAANINFLYAPEAAPTRFHAFATYTNTVVDIGSGHYCGTGPDFASLGYSAGQDVTLSFIYQLDGSTTYYYQCADITLVDSSSFVKPTYTCGNYTSTLQAASKEDSLQMSAIPADKTTGVNPHTSSVSGVAPLITGSSPSAEAVSSSSGLSAGAKGGIGAAVGVVALLLIGAAVYFIKNKSKKAKAARQQATADDASEVDSVQRMKQVQA